MNNNELPLDSKVELIPGMDSVYRRAMPGSTGVVKERKVDDYGFAMIYLEWDKSDYRYNGEKDGWVYESHFCPVGEAIIPEDIVEQAFDRAANEENGEEVVERYVASLEEAGEALMDGDGFMIISIKRIVGDNGIALVPIVIGDALDEETRALIEVQLLQIAAAIHQESSLALIQKTLRKRKRKDDDSDESGWTPSDDS